MSNSKDFDDELLLTKPTIDDFDDDELELLSPTQHKPDYLAPVSSIASEKIKTEADALEEMRMMQTNFVFLYGDSQTGKSAICASMLHFIMTNADVGFFEERGLGHGEGKSFIRDAVRAMSKKRFLPRTGHDSVTLAGGRFQPAKKGFSSIPITFMEMAGEECRNLVAPVEGKPFPKHIDLFLNDQSLNLVFMMVINHDAVTHEKDLLLSDFVDFIRSKDARFRGSRILLLVSKWDSYANDLTVGQFVQQFLPLTYASLSKNDNCILAYKVGRVRKVDGEPYIDSFDKESPRKTLQWLYHTITGKDFLKESTWNRFWKQFQD